MSTQRHRRLNQHTHADGPVIYWMSRDQRVEDNWALLHTLKLAEDRKQPTAVVFNLVTQFEGAPLRHLHFMIEGLKEVADSLEKRNIPFYILTGDPVQNLTKFTRDYKVGTLISDFSPLRIGRTWREAVADKLDIPVIEVDTHNIIPCWIASDKKEFAAYTLRPKIHRQLDSWLIEIPKISAPQYKWPHKVTKIDWNACYQSLKVDDSIGPTKIKPGAHAAEKTLKDFIKHGLKDYGEYRNHPEKNALSNLSPYLHFGQLAAQRVALEVQKLPDNPSKASFLEELIVRKELADNYCLYEPNYDNPKGFHDWAHKTLCEHWHDPREYEYSRKELEQAKTHDDLWNAAQLEMVKTGKIHGYMRMYWGKKILEWTKDPAQAMEHAIYLNDRYSLDGRDPNGYTGIAWCIGGVHDRAWAERPIFGKIRYMSFASTSKKFDSKVYINRWIKAKKNY